MVVRTLSCIALLSLATVCAGGEACAQLAGKEIHIGIGGPPATRAASFGVQMRPAVAIALDKTKPAAALLGAESRPPPADHLARRPTRRRPAPPVSTAP